MIKKTVSVIFAVRGLALIKIYVNLKLIRFELVDTQTKGTTKRLSSTLQHVSEHKTQKMQTMWCDVNWALAVALTSCWRFTLMSSGYPLLTPFTWDVNMLCVSSFMFRVTIMAPVQQWLSKNVDTDSYSLPTRYKSRCSFNMWTGSTSLHLWKGSPEVSPRFRSSSSSPCLTAVGNQRQEHYRLLQSSYKSRALCKTKENSEVCV